MKDTAELADWDMIEAQLPPNWRTLADHMGLIRPQRPQLNAEIAEATEPPQAPSCDNRHLKPRRVANRTRH